MKVFAFKSNKSEVKTDGIDEKFWECRGYDIPRKFRCNGVNNCGDNSDEEGCPEGNKLKEFQRNRCGF